MAHFRSILAVFISFGLAFAPAAAAALPVNMVTQPATVAAMDDCPHHKAAAATNEPRDHSGMMAKCDAAFCALKCFKVVAVFCSPALQTVFRGLPITPALPAKPMPRSWQPSPPPPRV